MTASDAVHRNALPSGHQLHWYQIDRILGQGGFGITYLAHDTNLNQRVAIKEYLPAELAVRDQDFSVHPTSSAHSEMYQWGLERFVTEGQTLARFDHPNIVRVLTVFEAGNTAYMVMRYEDGSTFADRVKGRKTLSEEQLRRIFLPLLDGLERVHNEYFIHRDIKPPNIFIREDGSPVLIDFGSARQAVGAGTRTLTTLISPGYAPFEQYSNRADEQGPWTDIYALAATMYRGMVGVAPPDAVERSHMLHANEPDPYQPAVEVGHGHYSQPFLAMVDWGLQFRRQNRPPSIAAWRKALEEGITHARAEAITAVAAEATVPVSDVTAQTEKIDPTVALGEAGSDATTETEQPSTPPQKKRYGLILLVLVIAVIAALLWMGRQRPQESITSPATTETPAPAVDKPAPTTPAEATPESAETASAEDSIPALLKKARTQAAANRRILPAGNNAFETYRTILSREPDNSRAREGLRQVVETEMNQIVDALAEKDFDIAETRLDRLIELAPNSERLVQVRERVLQAKAARR